MGAWRQTNVRWKKPPAELELKQRYAEAAVLYFRPDQRFALVYGTVIQGHRFEAISGGDGRVVYVGTWKLTGDSLHVEYRLVSRTVPKEGEALPGPVHREDVRVRGSTLLFQKNRFRRDEKLDGDDEFKIILERESARQSHPALRNHQRTCCMAQAGGRPLPSLTQTAAQQSPDSIPAAVVVPMFLRRWK